jgi:hypothetical protein
MSQLQHLIAEFALPVNLLTFCDLFLYSDSWYEHFLLNSLHDRNITIGGWNDCDDQQSKVREVKSEHPSKVSFPGLPSHAESLKLQKLTINLTNNSLVLIETNKFHGIPMSDYFRVDTVWNVEEMATPPPPLSPTSPSPSIDSSVRIRISCEVVFHQSTWLKGTIESNTKSELLSVFTLWKDAALKTIADHQQASLAAMLHLNNNQMILDQPSSSPQERGARCIDSIPSSTSVTDIRFPPLFVLEDSEVNATQNIFSDTEFVFYDCEEGNQPSSSGGQSAGEGEEMDEEFSSLLRDVKLKQEERRGVYQSHPGQRYHPFDRYLLSKRDIAVDPFRYLQEGEEEDEDDSEDEEEGGAGGALNGDHPLPSLPFNRRRLLKTKNSSDSIHEEKDGATSDSNSKRKKSKKYPLASSAMSYRPLLTPAQILEIYGSSNSATHSAPSSPTNQTANKSPTTPPDARHLAGAIAEILFVLVESIFWQVDPSLFPSRLRLLSLTWSLASHRTDSSLLGL